MVASLRTRLGRWRSGIFAGLLAFAIGQTIGLAHTADASLHTDDAPCQICQAIGHAAAAPTPATAPVASIVLRIVVPTPVVVAPVLPLLFSSHAPRAPPVL